jgi:hypothetical protein
LDVAETGFKSNPPTVTIQTRNDAVENVKKSLHSLKADVQEAVNKSPKDAAIITASAGMLLKKSTRHQGLRNSVKDGVVEGSVLLRAREKGPHEWRCSTDETIWTNLPSTRKAHTKVANLKLGQLYYFQNRPILTNEQEAPWSQSIKFIVR